uniref:Beta-defensin-like domain-containing protein n=1 Tax=Chelydra serpentina TaxID=8475 RepID=A0A8C3SZ67_CHESE
MWTQTSPFISSPTKIALRPSRTEHLLFFYYFSADSDRGIIGTVACLARRGRCRIFRCPRGTRRIGRCTRFNPCCRRRVSSGFYYGDITV